MKNGFACHLVCAAIFIALACAAPFAHAQATSSFDLPVQPLADSLRAVGSQTNTSVLFDPSLVANRKAPALKGDLTADQALGRLLAGTGIHHEFLNDKTITLAVADPANGVASSHTSASKEQSNENASAHRSDAGPGAAGDGSKNSNGSRLHLAQLAQGPPSSAVSVASGDQKGTDANLDTIVVTGSRFAREALQTDQPVVTIDGDYLKDRGITNVGDALNELPATIGNAINSTGYQNAFNVGVYYINLFDLGSQRTLTLVDGRRYVSDNPLQFQKPIEAGSQVDLNSLPTLFIDHIDQLPATGAAVYGSDAIAGVVNIITKKKFEGFQADAQGGISKYGDAPKESVKLAVGRNFFNDQLNIAADVEYDRTSGFAAAARPFCNTNCQFVANPNATGPAQILIGNATFPTLTPGGLPYTLNGQNINLPGTTTQAQFANNGQLIGFNPGTVYNPFVAAGGDGLYYPAIYPLYSGVQREVGTLMANYEPSQHLRVHAQVNFAASQAHDPLEQPEAAFAPEVAGIGGTYGAYEFSLNNPFLSSQARSVLVANGVTSNFLLARANTDWTPSVDHQKNQTIESVLSLDGDFESLDRKFNYQVAVTEGQSRSTLSQTLFVFGNPTYGVPNLLSYALDAVPGPNGQPICNVQAQNPNSNNPYIRNCVPLNPFGAGNNNAAALAYAQTAFINHDANEQTDLQANIGGPIVHLPAGDWKFLVGFEHRRESASFSPSTASLEGLGAGQPTLPGDASFSTNEIYGESLLPIIAPDQNIPFIHRFDIDGAYRHVNHSIAGSDDSWSYGLQFSPVDGLTFRGSRSRTFRSPALVEQFTTQSSQYDIGSDPCQASNLPQGSNPAARQRNCAAAFTAAGLPANYQLIYSNVGYQPIPVTVTGNSGLRDEIGHSFTLGFLAKPLFAPGLQISADYVSINITDAIEFEAISALLIECYDSPTYPSPSCSQFGRTAAGQVTGPGGAVTGPNETFINAGFLRLRGMSYAASYNRNIADLPFVHTDRDLGTFGWSLNALNTRELDLSVSGLGFDEQQLAGIQPQYNGGTQGAARWKWHNDLRYGYQRFQFMWTTQFIAGSNFAPNLSTKDQEPIGVGTYYMHSVSAQYKLTQNISIRANVNNVFNRQPPYPAQEYGGYDVLGRYFLLGVHGQF